MDAPLVELLESPSAPMAARSLDNDLFRLFEPAFVAHLEAAQADFLPIRDGDVESIRTPAAYVAAHAPQYTTSTDEALALVRRHCPVHPNCVDQFATEVRLQIGDDFASALLDRDTFSGDQTHFGRGSTPALAICAAMVRMLSASADAAQDVSRESK